MMPSRIRIHTLTVCAGLACAASSHAQQAANSHRNDHPAAPVLRAPRGALNTPAQLEQHRRWVDAQRALIRRDERRWQTAASLDLVDDLLPPVRRSLPSAPRDFRSHNINQPWGVLIDSDDFALDFEESVYQITTLDPTAENPFVPLRGTVHTNDNPWIGNGGASYTGIVDNAAAQTGPRWDPDGADDDPSTEGVLEGDPDQHGEIGGPDPLGEHGKFIAAAAGTIATQPFSGGSRLEGWLRHKFYIPTTDTPVVTIVDMYHDRVDAGMWWSPLSQTEGNFFVLSSFWFGFTFSNFASLADPDGVIRRPLILGPGFDSGRFFVHPATSPWEAKTDEWFSVGIRMTVDSYSIWVRDSQTIGTNGFAQNSIYDAFSGGVDPANMLGAFAGEIFENDWLQITPGVDDDPGTGIIEGYGPSLTDFGQPYTLITDTSGSPAGPPFNSAGIDTIHFRGGFDPSTTNVPGWTPSDHYIDNYVVLGKTPDTFVQIPDFVIPFIDDIESWFPFSLTILPANQWFVALLQNPTVTTVSNNTPGGNQSVQQIGTFLNNVYQVSFARLGLPVVTASATTPAVAQMSIRISDNFMSRGFAPQDTREHDLPLANIIFGGRDANFLVNNLIYARQPNPLYDSTISQTEVSGENIIDDGIANVPLVSVPLVDPLTLIPLIVPTGAWFDARVEVLFDSTGNAQHPMSVFFDFGSGMVQGVPDGSVRGITTLTAPTPSVNRLESWVGAEVGSFLNTIHVDDLILDGPRTDDRYNVEVEDPGSSYANDIAFALPYFDDLSAYDLWHPIGNRGVTPFLSTVFSGANFAIDIVDVLSAPVAGVTPVFLYAIEEVDIQGTLPGGPYAGGEVVAIVDNLPAFFDTTIPTTIPGSTDPADPTRVNYRDPSRVRQAAADLELNNTVSAPWDGVTPVIGRFQFRFDWRWSSPDGQNLVVEDPTASGRGNMVSLVTRADADAVDGDLDWGINLRLPDARALGGRHARLEFDVWIGDGASALNSGRVVWSVMGRSVNREPIAQIAFGGPNNFPDAHSFDPVTGVITLGVPDGLADSFQFNDFQGDPSHIYVRAANPDVFSTEDLVWVDTGDTAPANTWVHCSVSIDTNGNWDATIDDGVTTLNYSGAPLTSVTGSGSPVDGTDYFQIDLGNDEGSDGRTQLPPIQWYSLGENAAPEDGLDFLNEPAGPGSFNPDRKYFYYSVSSVLPPALNLPQITDVFGGDGTILFARDLAEDDHVVLWNDQSTAGMGGPVGVPIDPNQTPRNTRWEIVDELAPSTVLARGFWTPLGLPGTAGVASPAQLGGIVNFSPPYGGDIPFDDILMGTMVNLPQPADFASPLLVTYIDNISLTTAGCLGDLTGDGQTNGTDLLILLGGWNFPGLSDLNGDGTTSGTDLLLLLGGWGPCP